LSIKELNVYCVHQTGAPVLKLIKMISNYDYLVVVTYFLLMIAVGVVFKRMNKNTSDYFRGGGSMLWWLVGATTFMSFISAVTYTGAAGKAYETGTFVFVVYMANGLGFFISYLYFSKRFRQTRVVTAIEVVRERFGKANEQFFTWMVVPFGVIHGGVWLYSLGIIISTIFGVSMEMTVLSVGVTVLVISLLGGSWAVVASDFMQLMIMVPVAIVMAFLSLRELGGLGEFVNRLPTSQYNWSELADGKIVWLWFVASFCKQFFSVNNTNDGYRFLAVKDSAQARKASLMASILFFTITIIWFIPPMAASIMFPDISAIESLKPLGDKAVDGIYLAMGIELLPAGMIGVMICAIFAATMSSMDSTLNRNAGIFVRNFYKPILRKSATEKELFRVSLITTIVLGGLVILSAIFFSELEGINLFDINMRLGAMISLPFMIPLTWGIVFQNTPRWAGWSTVLLGMLISYTIQTHVGPETLLGFLGVDKPWSDRELIDVMFFSNVFAVILICSAWFLGTRLFRNTSSEIYHKQVGDFFVKINTPVDYEKEHGHKGSDDLQFKILGNMCLIYGTFLSLLVLIPNNLTGRLCFVFIGGVMLTVGFVFKKKYKRSK
jgi:SSS family solute:Na+ symporter